MSNRPWHKRFHGDAITGYMGLTLEERGAYSTFLDYLYDRGEPLTGNLRMLAGFLDVSVRKAETVIDSLVEKGKLTRLPDGRLTNRRFEVERQNDTKTSDHMAEIGSEGGRKSAELRKKPSKNKGGPKRPLDARSSYPDARSQKPDKKEEGGGVPTERPAKRRSGIPADFPTQAAKEAAVKFWSERGRRDLADRLDDEVAQFRDHHAGHGKVMADWPAAWRTWLRNALRITRPPADGGAARRAAPEPPADIPLWTRRLVAFHRGDEEWGVEKGYWQPKWGPKPGVIGCQAPQEAWYAFRAKHPAPAGAGG